MEDSFNKEKQEKEIFYNQVQEEVLYNSVDKEFTIYNYDDFDNIISAKIKFLTDGQKNYLNSFVDFMLYNNKYKKN